MSQPEGPTARGPAEERRLVTVLFADVVGSTALGEALDPEDVRALLARLFSIARDAVERHGGRVEKFIGDAVMAVFGLPIAHDDDASRALSAALELRDRVRDDPALGERLPIRLGVNGGEVIAARDPGAGEVMVTGDAVNTAARLQQASEPWAVLVGERTVQAVGGRFTFGELREVEAKGKAQPMRARFVEAAVAGARRGPRHPLVGRDEDLTQLELVARRAFRERRPYLVSIVAPAGTGKSRLLEEFLDGITAGTDAAVAIAQCLPYGQRLTYWPMRALALSILDLPDDVTLDRLRDAAATWLGEAGDPEPARTAELLAATLGAGDESGDRIALFNAWRRFIELAAERRPLVLVIEDLHWSSDSLLDLAEAILQPRADVPILMIALARPELLDRRATWGGGRRNSVSIALEPLEDEAVEALVVGLLEAPSPAIVEAVVARAEGNPFYAGEIVRSLLDRLGPDPDPAMVGAAIAALPDSVHGTVLARLDALEPDARRCVQLGAVLGRSFQLDALPALEPELSSEHAAIAVDALIERDLVRPGGPRRVTFRHILIREVAYGTLPRAERARLHAAAGRWLETVAIDGGREDELAELIAFHFREATSLRSITGELATDDLTDRAWRWSARAGDAAAVGAAAAEAARHYQAAIELAPPRDQADLQERLGEVWVGGDQAQAAFAAAVELGQRFDLGPDQALRTLAQRITVETRWFGSISARPSDEEFRASRDRLDAMRASATELRARTLAALAGSFLAFALDAATPADFARAEDSGREALRLARELGDADLQSAALDGLTGRLLADDRVHEAISLVDERRELVGTSTSERLDAIVMTAWMRFLGGDFEGAEQAVLAGRANLSPGQGAAWVMGGSAWRVGALMALGRWDEALVEAGRMEQAWRESEVPTPGYAVNGFTAAWLITTARRDGAAADHWREMATSIIRRVEATSRMRAVFSLFDGDAEGIRDRLVDAYPVFSSRLDHVMHGLIWLADHGVPRRPTRLEELLAYATERRVRPVAAHALRAIGIADASPEALTAAIAAFDEMRAVPAAARARTELAILTGDRALFDRGAAELERLGDVDQLERIERRWAARG